MNMRRLLAVVFSCLFPLTSFSEQATDSVAGWGQVNMQGTIIDSACDISVENRNQTVDMENDPLPNVIRDGQGRSKMFSIKLVNCVLEQSGNKDRKKFQVTFDGHAEGGLFGLHGDAAGVALQITDHAGNIALPGKALPLMDFIYGGRQLNYTMKLVINNHALKFGEYFSSILFKLDYL